MKFFSDESVDNRITLFLKKEGFDISSVHEHTTGIPDEEVLEYAYKQSAILITEDRDFGYLVVQLNQKHKGVVLLRIKGKNILERCELVRDTLQKYKDEIQGNFTVIASDTVRIRFLNIKH